MKRLRGLNALMHGGSADRAAMIRGWSIFQLAKRQWSMYVSAFRSSFFLNFFKQVSYLTQNIKVDLNMLAKDFLSLV